MFGQSVENKKKRYRVLLVTVPLKGCLASKGCLSMVAPSLSMVAPLLSVCRNGVMQAGGGTSNEAPRFAQGPPLGALPMQRAIRPPALGLYIYIYIYR